MKATKEQKGSKIEADCAGRSFPVKLPLLAVLASTFLVASAFAQSTEIPAAPVLHVQSNLVVLDVVVTDNDGHIVSDLTKDDFTVFENKVPQSIRSFESIDAHAMPAASNEKALVTSSADLRKIGQASITILVLDELPTLNSLTSKFMDMAYTRQRVEAYLKSQPNILTHPTTLLVVRADKFLVLHDYTQDREALLDTLKKYIPVNPQMSGVGAGAGQLIIMSMGSLQQIAKSEMGVPGRKNIIWVGTGFPGFDPAYAPQPILESLQSSIRATTDLLLHARVTLSVIAPAGLVGTSSMPIQPPGQAAANEDSSALANNLDMQASTINSAPDQGTFSFINFAPLTGGRFFNNSNDIDEEVATGISDGDNYYSLSYIPRNTADSAAQYRSIRVALKRPGLHAVTRQGYYPPDALAPLKLNPGPQQIADTAIKNVEIDLINAAENRMSYNAIDVQSLKKSSANSYQVYVKASDLDWQMQPNGKYVASAALLLVDFSAQNKVVGRSFVEISKSLVQPPTPGSDGLVMYEMPFEAPPNSARLRLVLRDATSAKIGTVDLKFP